MQCLQAVLLGFTHTHTHTHTHIYAESQYRGIFSDDVVRVIREHFSSLTSLVGMTTAPPQVSLEAVSMHTESVFVYVCIEYSIRRITGVQHHTCIRREVLMTAPRKGPNESTVTQASWSRRPRRGWRPLNFNARRYAVSTVAHARV